ncbi:hypothetical protein TNCV_794551 [Trichonephila clavipes]|nr:hypothetical protein TNCV_794551 [Trichonephila clavipes]
MGPKRDLPLFLQDFHKRILFGMTVVPALCSSLGMVAYAPATNETHARLHMSECLIRQAYASKHLLTSRKTDRLVCALWKSWWNPSSKR